MADALSPIEAVSQTIEYTTLAEAQKQDCELRDIMQKNASNHKLQNICFPDFDTDIYCEVSRNTI